MVLFLIATTNVVEEHFSVQNILSRQYMLLVSFCRLMNTRRQ